MSPPPAHRLTLAAALLLTTVGSAPAHAQPQHRPHTADPIAWHLTSEPTVPTITMAARRMFRIWMEARNVGAHVADTRRDSLEWLLNGQPSMTAAMAWGNGGRVADWAALRPGATVREARDLGELLFPAPGDYELVARREGRDVARLRVRVIATPVAR